LADIDLTLGILFFLQAAVLFFAGLAIMLSYGPAAMAGLAALLMGLGIGYGLATMVVLQALGIGVKSVAPRIGTSRRTSADCPPPIRASNQDRLSSCPWGIGSHRLPD
jgi:hypothetical protein